LNIHNMVNKSRGDMAYTLVDVDSPVAPGVLDAIGAIDGVLSVRLPAAAGETAEAASPRPPQAGRHRILVERRTSLLALESGDAERRG